MEFPAQRAYNLNGRTVRYIKEPGGIHSGAGKKKSVRAAHSNQPFYFTVTC